MRRSRLGDFFLINFQLFSNFWTNFQIVEEDEETEREERAGSDEKWSGGRGNSKENPSQVKVGLNTFTFRSVLELQVKVGLNTFTFLCFGIASKGQSQYLYIPLSF